MNAKILLFLVAPLFLAIGRAQEWADASNPGWRMRALEIEECAIHPYRKIKGKLYDLTPRIAFAKTGNRKLDGSPLFGSKPLEDFEFIHGRILSVDDEGILLRRYGQFDYFLRGDYELVFVKNYPFAVADDERVSVYAVASGTISYVTPLKARKTVRCFDHGTIPNATEIESLKTEGHKRAKNYEDAMAAEKASADIGKAKKDEQGKAAAIKFLKEKAAEGAPMSQYRLAEKYIAGDGVPIDLDLAKFWLQASCTNGYAEASNLLQKIQSGQITSKP